MGRRCAQSPIPDGGFQYSWHRGLGAPNRLGVLQLGAWPNALHCLGVRPPTVLRVACFRAGLLHDRGKGTNTRDVIVLLLALLLLVVVLLLLLLVLLVLVPRWWCCWCCRCCLCCVLATWFPGMPASSFRLQCVRVASYQYFWIVFLAVQNRK